MSTFAAMTRDEVIANYLKLLRDLHLEPANVWLGGGSAMIMYGLRETTADLDAGCSPGMLRTLSRITHQRIQTFNISDGYLKDNTQLIVLEKYATDLHAEDDVKASDLCLVDGVNVYTLEKLLAQKQMLLERLNRDKDRRDIDALKKLMRHK